MQKSPICPKCNNYYSTKDSPKYNRNPILLLCGHTFCVSCLHRETNKSTMGVTCPACHRITPLENEASVKSLGPDVYTTGLIVCNQKILLDQELSKLTPAGMSTAPARPIYHERRERLCRECCRRQAVCKCDRCDFIMCKLCFSQVHSISNTLKQHQAIPLTQEESSHFQLEVASKCQEHEGKLLEYYCEDDNITVCSRCVITGNHKNHSILSMEEKNRSVMSEIEPALQTANVVLKKMKKAEKTLLGLLPDMKTETSEVLQEISHYFTGLHSILQAREKQLTMEVYQAFRSGVEPLHELRQQMLEDTKQLESTVKAAHRFLGSSDEVVLNAKEILQSLQQAKDLPCIVEPQKPETKERIRFDRGSDITESIWQHGIITGKVPAKAISYSVKDKPESIILDDTDSLGSKTPADSVSVISSRISDVIIEGESNVDNQSSHGSQRSLTPDLDTIPTREKIKGSATQVFVTHIKNPCLFMVQKASDQYKLQQLSRTINSYANSRSAPMPKKLERGDLVLARFSGDSKWYRARVRNVTPGETPESTIVEVIYIDYGNAERITMERVRTIQPKHSRQPEMLIECCLHDIRPPNDTGTWPQESVATFAKMTADKKMNLLVVREVNNVLHVDLCKPPNEDIRDDRPVSVRDSLVFLELAQFISPDAGNVVGQSAVRRTFLNPEPKPIGCTFTGLVTCSGEPSAFYVQEITEDSQYFAQLMGAMQDRYSLEKGDLWAIDCPQIDMPCACQFSGDNMWYRAKVIGLPGGKQVDVLYVDFGNSERVPHYKLRKILDHFIKMPVQGLLCSLADVAPVNEWTSEGRNWWVREVTMKVFNVHVLRSDKTGLSVILQDDNLNSTINGELVEAGHAISTGQGSLLLPPQSNVDSSDESYSARSEVSSRSTASYATPTSSPSKPDQPLRAPAVRVRPSPVTQSVGLTPKQPSPSPSRQMASVSPHKEKADSPEKAKQSSSSDSVKTASTTKQNSVKSSSSDSSLSSVRETSTTKHRDIFTTEPSVELEVDISHFVAPNHFYIQVANKRERLQMLMEALGNEYRTSEDQWVTWEPNVHCAARHPVDKSWYRGKILKVIHKNLVEIFFVDYGFIEQMGISEIRPLQKQFIKDMCYAFRCHLADILSAGDMTKWSRTACEFMEAEIKGKKLFIQKKGDAQDNSLPVDLLVEEEIAETALEPSRKSYYSLTDKLIDNGLAIPTKRRKKKVQVEDQVVKQKKVYPVFHWRPAVMPPDSTLAAYPVYVDFEGTIFLQEQSDNENVLPKMTDRLQEKFDMSEPHKIDEIRWQEGQACVALFHLEHKWHRARVLSVESHRIKVVFVDFGNVEFVTYDHIRADVMEFIETPILSLQCVLHNAIPISESGKWPVLTLNRLHERIVNQLCVIDIQVKEPDQILQVDMTLPTQEDVATWLSQQGLCYRINNISHLVDRSKKIAHILSWKTSTYPKVRLAPVNEYFPVMVTHVEIPDVVYFQHVKREENGDERTDEINEQLTRLQLLSAEINQIAPTCSYLPTPKPGLPCLGQYTFDSCWYRGLIIDVKEQFQTVTVLYVDYGNSETIALEGIRALPVNYLDLPAQGIRMKLNGVRMAAGQKYWTEDILNKMQTELISQVRMACMKTTSPVTGDLLEYQAPGEPMRLAYQSLIDAGLIQSPDENQLFDEALVGVIEDDVIVESENITDDLDISSSTTKGDNSLSTDDKPERQRNKSWSDTMDEEDPLD